MTEYVVTRCGGEGGRGTRERAVGPRHLGRLRGSARGVGSEASEWRRAVAVFAEETKALSVPFAPLWGQELPSPSVRPPAWCPSHPITTACESFCLAIAGAPCASFLPLTGGCCGIFFPQVVPGAGASPQLRGIHRRDRHVEHRVYIRCATAPPRRLAAPRGRGRGSGEAGRFCEECGGRAAGGALGLQKAYRA